MKTSGPVLGGVAVLLVAAAGSGMVHYKRQADTCRQACDALRVETVRRSHAAPAGR
jgi:uncharacterized protein HemX